MNNNISSQDLNSRLSNALESGSLATSVARFYEETEHLVVEDKRDEWKSYLHEVIQPCLAPEGHFVEKQCWIDAPIRAALEVMELLSEGCSPRYAQSAIDRYHFSGFPGAKALQIAAYLSPRGEEFREFLRQR